mgnify:CR=1 FL=1
MSRRVTRLATVSAIFALLSIGGVASSAQASDGPIIGVQIDSGPSSHVIQVGPGGLFVEYPGGKEDLPAGSFTLTLSDQKAQLGPILFDRPMPFRIRGAEHPIQLDDRFYEGWLEIHAPKGSSSWLLVNRLPLERYLLGVIPGEMPVESYPPGALAAQAVAARTYALFQILVRPSDQRVHVFNDTRSQMYVGGGTAHPNTVRAVESTRGQVLLYGDKVFECFFHSTCGGGTRPVEHCYGGDPIAPLSSVTCKGCTSSKYYRWDVRLSVAALGKLLEPLCKKYEIDLGPVHSVEPVEPSLGGHCAYVLIRHAKGTFELESEKFRRLVRVPGKRELRSTSFVAERKGDEVVFYGRGWGHGVGLCQVGAKGYAEAGSSHLAILTHFYPGAEVQVLWK